MLNVEDFIDKYKNYNDEELYQVYETIDNYSEEAKTALYKVIEKRGGLDSILNNLKDKKAIQKETLRIRNETTKLCSNETNAEFIKTLVTSETLSKPQVDEIIDARFAEFESLTKDRSVNSKTIVLALVGMVIASVIGGVLWGLQLIYSKRIFTILAMGLALLCYGIISLITKKSKKNQVVVIATILAIVFSILIGQLLYAIVGYQE
jgi:RsiW-degrading membrane proteinase PrsW (M82 family)